MDRFWKWLKYDVLQGLRNLLVYAPVIWRTREWDQAYLYELMAFKLKRMEKTLRHGVAQDRTIIADQIKVMRLALERLIEDDYMLVLPSKLAYREQIKDLKIVAEGIIQSQGFWD